MKMKSFIILWLVFITNVMALPQPGQPKLLGLSSSYYHQYVYLLPMKGRNTTVWGFTVKHWKLFENTLMTFGDGQQSTVKTVWTIRGGTDVNQYDLAMVELKTPVTVQPEKVWWYRPSNFSEFFTVRVYGLDGMIESTNAWWSEGRPPGDEYKNGIWYNNTLVRGGYSGAPVFFADSNGDWKFIGVNSLAWRTSSDPPNTYRGGVASVVPLVFEEFWNLFPGFLQPPSQPSVAIQQMSPYQTEITLKYPLSVGSEWRVTSSDLSTTDPWTPVQDRVGFGGYDDCPGPWEKILRWDISSHSKMFFRGERHSLPSAPASMQEQLAPLPKFLKEESEQDSDLVVEPCPLP